MAVVKNVKSNRVFQNFRWVVVLMTDSFEAVKERI